MNTLFWVRVGVAYVEFRDHETVRLAAGQGVWIPEDCARRMRTEPGAVALPLFIARKDVPGRGATDPRRFEVTPEWEDRLIGHYSQVLSGHSAIRYAPRETLDVVGFSSSGCRLHSPDKLPLPSSSEALTVARGLLVDPANPSTVQKWAAQAMCSERTLQRQFSSETGLTFAQWRSRCRTNAGAEILASGGSVAHAAAMVGFIDRTSFARAFREHQGVSPREFLNSRHSDASERQKPSCHTADVLRSTTKISQETAPDQVLRNALPATRIQPHSHDFHLLTWIYRGSRKTVIEGCTYEQAEGDALWIPAGQEHSHILEAGTISFVLALPTAEEIQINRPLLLHFPTHWDDYLLWQAVSTISLLRPKPCHRARLLNVFRDQLTYLRTQIVPMPTDIAPLALAREFLRTMRDSDGDHVSHDVLTAFRRDTGMTFQRWKYVSRMRIARDLLAEGATVTSAARQVGYTYLPNFTHAFRSYHGMPPSSFRQSVTSR